MIHSWQLGGGDFSKRPNVWFVIIHVQVSTHHWNDHVQMAVFLGAKNVEAWTTTACDGIKPRSGPYSLSHKNLPSWQSPIVGDKGTYLSSIYSQCVSTALPRFELFLLHVQLWGSVCSSGIRTGHWIYSLLDGPPPANFIHSTSEGCLGQVRVK